MILWSLVATLLGVIATATALANDIASELDPRNDFVHPPEPAGLALPEYLEPAPDPSVVDIGFFYDQEFRVRGQSLSSLDLVANTMISYTNDAFAASGLALTLRIAYAGELHQPLAGLDTHSAFGEFGTHATAIRDSLLTDYGVDAAVLLRATDDADSLFGIAVLGTVGSLSDSATVPHAMVCLGAAPSSGLECFGHGGIFAHEIGHLFGAGHQRNAPVGGSGGAFEFSYASECGGGTIVYSPLTAAQSIYSTPNITVENEPCGVSASAGADGIDNAHTIDLTRALMADLRASMPLIGAVGIDNSGDISLTEGDLPIQLQISRSGNLSLPARVNLDVLSSPGGRADVAFTPELIEFGPGQDAVAAELRVIDDVQDEPNETVVLGLRNPWRLQADAAPVTLTIVDNDEPPPPVPPPTGDSGGGAIGLLSLLACLLLSILARLVRSRLVAARSRRSG